MINNEKSKINVFEFDQIDFNLAEYSSNTILVPKIQEISSKELFYCSYKIFKNELNQLKDKRCEKKIIREINQEILKRFYKPLYIPIIGILCCFLFIISKNSISYNKNRRTIFLITFFILIFSEASLRYSTISTIATFSYLIIPWLMFILIYYLFYKRTKNV